MLPAAGRPVAHARTAAPHSCDVAVFEMGQDEGGAGDGTGFAGAGGDVLEAAPALVEQGEPAFAEAAQGTRDGVAGAGVDVEFSAASGLLDGNQDAGARALISGVGKGSSPAAAAG
jgi:hypothetical protein